MTNSKQSPDRMARAKKAARAELERRKAARDGLLRFTEYTMADYRAGPQNVLLCEKLDAVERGEIKRLIVSMPPRHGKSELTSKRFPAYYLGRHPTRQVMTASYGADLAQGFGRDVRNIVASQEFGRLFPEVGLAKDSAAKDKWHTTKGGVYVAAGVGGALTGRGAHLALIDDPVKDRQDADSDTIRENVWDWYRSVLRTRLMPGGAIVLVLTRWHPDDLAGRLIDEMKAGTGEQWEVLSLPALADSPLDPLGRTIGEPLWPKAFGKDALSQIEKAIGPREWSALFQQEPTPGEGNLFKTANIGVIDAAPIGGRIVRRWDLAATKQIGTRDPDWTVGVKMLRTLEDRYVVLDVCRLRGAPEEVERAIINTAAQDGRGVEIVLPEDPGQAGKSQVAYMTQKLAGYTVFSVRETGDKATRAAPFASQVNVGNVSMVRAPWNAALIEEMRQFPAGSHDDQVDAGSGAFEALAPQVTKMPDFSQFASYKRRY